LIHKQLKSYFVECISKKLGHNSQSLVSNTDHVIFMYLDADSKLKILTI